MISRIQRAIRSVRGVVLQSLVRIEPLIAQNVVLLFKLSLISRAKALLCKKINCVDFFAFKNSAVLCSYCALSVFVKAPLTDGGWHPHTLEWFFTSSVDGSARHSIRRNTVVGREEVGEGGCCIDRICCRERRAGVGGSLLCPRRTEQVRSHLGHQRGPVWHGSANPVFARTKDARQAQRLLWWKRNVLDAELASTQIG